MIDSFDVVVGPPSSGGAEGGVGAATCPGVGVGAGGATGSWATDTGGGVGTEGATGSGEEGGVGAAAPES